MIAYRVDPIDLWCKVYRLENGHEMLVAMFRDPTDAEKYAMGKMKGISDGESTGKGN
jgi:hypothetical protein